MYGCEKQLILKIKFMMVTSPALLAKKKKKRRKDYEK